MLALSIACVLAAVAWGYLVAGHSGYWRTSQRPPPVTRDPDTWPDVVAVVPARNEAEMLPAMLPALLPMLRLYRLSPLRAPALPLIALLYAGMTADSARRHYTGRGAEWRGRTDQGPLGLPRDRHTPNWSVVGGRAGSRLASLRHRRRLHRRPTRRQPARGVPGRAWPGRGRDAAHGPGAEPVRDRVLPARRGFRGRPAADLHPRRRTVLRRPGPGLEDPDIRAVPRGARGPGHRLRGRAAGGSPGPARADRLRRRDRDPARRGDRQAVAAVRAGQGLGGQGGARTGRRFGRHRGPRRIPAQLVRPRRRVNHDGRGTRSRRDPDPRKVFP